MVAAAGLWLVTKEEDTTQPLSGIDATAQSTRPGIAVLPFDNLSHDPAQEYFSNGITEDLITDLSKLSGLLVVARNTFCLQGSLQDEQPSAVN